MEGGGRKMSLRYQTCRKYMEGNGELASLNFRRQDALCLARFTAKLWELNKRGGLFSTKSLKCSFVSFRSFVRLPIGKWFDRTSNDFPRGDRLDKCRINRFELSIERRFLGNDFERILTARGPSRLYIDPSGTVSTFSRVDAARWNTRGTDCGTVLKIDRQLSQEIVPTTRRRHCDVSEQRLNYLCVDYRPTGLLFQVVP